MISQIILTSLSGFKVGWRSSISSSMTASSLGFLKSTLIQLLHLNNVSSNAFSRTAKSFSSLEGPATTTPMDLFISRLSVSQSGKSRTPLSEASKTQLQLAEAKPKDIDVECDRVLSELVDRNAVQDTLTSLKQFALFGRFPTSKTVLRMASMCAGAGHVEGVRLVRDLGFQGSWTSLDKLMNLRHYEAEAVWRTGDHLAALAIFRELFQKHPTAQRKKLVDISCFCLRDIVNKGRLSDPIVQSAVLDFVEDICATVSCVPAANLWRAAFYSESYDAQCLAQTLINRLDGPALRLAVRSKIAVIVYQSRQDWRPDVLQRLMQTLLSMDMKDCYGEVMSAYVEHLCDVEDVSGAREALHFMNQMSIYIESATAHRMITLLVRHGKVGNRGRPTSTLDSNNVPTVPTSQYKF